MRDRKYYGYLYTDADTIATDDGDFILLEYSVDDKDASTPHFEMTGRGFLPNGKVYDHCKYCKTCQDGVKPDIKDNWLYWEHVETNDLPR